MSRVSNDFVQHLKSQLNISEVVGQYVRLRKTGANHMGLCPFHAERSPSFSVSEKKGIYYCFGCHKGGDVISFIEEIQSISFPDAVRLLAANAQIKVPLEFAQKMGRSAEPSTTNAASYEVYFKLNRFVAQFYHERLFSPEGSPALEYLRKRGLSEATIRQAYVGYAPAGWSQLFDFLSEKKAPIDKAEELGLLRKKTQGYYDLFRDRILFPVTDSRGRIMAFGGRIFRETTDEGGPKYLNSPESPIFRKGTTLFGLFFAQKEIRVEDRIVVVEGFMDCLSLQQSGIGYTVATLGTALTERQVSTIKRFTKNVVMLFDGDSAGQEAQLRAMQMFLDQDVVTRGVVLPEGFDPDQFVNKNGAEQLKEMINSSSFLLDQKILELRKNAGTHTELAARALDEILPWISKLTSDTARHLRLEEVANLFNVQFNTLVTRVNQLRLQTRSAGTKSHSPSALQRTSVVAKIPKADPIDQRTIEFFARYPQAISKISDVTSFIEGLNDRSVWDLIQRISALGDNVESILDDIKERPDFQSAIAKALLSNGVAETTSFDIELRDLEMKLIRRGLEKKRESLRVLIKKLEDSGETLEFSKYMNEYKDLVKRLDGLGPEPGGL